MYERGDRTGSAGLVNSVGGGQVTEKEWYDNKTLYEMMVDLSKRLEHTNAELEKTQVLIRDYNGPAAED